MERKKIVYMPYPYLGVETNEISSNMVNILKEDYDVVGRMDPLLNLASIIKTKAIILNWTEKNLTEEQKRQIIEYKKYGTKIIWVFHNRVAHEDANVQKEKKNMIWLADNSDYIILLSKSSKQYVPGREENQRKTRYVPHVKYKSCVNLRITKALIEKYQIKENEFVYCIYGRIRPYKNIETAIRCFNMISDKNARLIIAGQPITEEYGNQIEKLTVENKQIVTDFRFLSNMELDSIISLSDVVLMTYAGISSMNSGVLIKAFSEGKAVIAPQICMVNDISSKEDFLYRWQIDDTNMLCQQMLQAYGDGKVVLREKGKRAAQYINENNSEEIVKQALNDILNEDNDNKNSSILYEEQMNGLEHNPLEKEVEWYSNNYRNYHYLFRIMCQWMNLKNNKIEISDWIKTIGWESVAIYGMGEMGQALLVELKSNNINVVYGIDRNADNIHADIPILKLSNNLEKVDGIIVTAVAYYDEIKKEVQKKLDVPIMSIKDILDEMQYIKYM